MGRVEVSQGDEVALIGHGHTFGVAAVAEQTRFGGVGADHLLLGGTGPAVRLPAPPARVDQHRSQARVPGRDLVAEDDGQHGGVVAGGGMEVRMADPAGEYVDHGVAAGIGHLAEGEGRSRLGQHHCTHGDPFVISPRNDAPQTTFIKY